MTYSTRAGFIERNLNACERRTGMDGTAEHRIDREIGMAAMRARGPSALLRLVRCMYLDECEEHRGLFRVRYDAWIDDILISSVLQAMCNIGILTEDHEFSWSLRGEADGSGQAKSMNIGSYPLGCSMRRAAGCRNPCLLCRVIAIEATQPNTPLSRPSALAAT